MLNITIFIKIHNFEIFMSYTFLPDKQALNLQNFGRGVAQQQWLRFFSFNLATFSPIISLKNLNFLGKFYLRHALKNLVFFDFIRWAWSLQAWKLSSNGLWRCKILYRQFYYITVYSTSCKTKTMDFQWALI